MYSGRCCFTNLSNMLVKPRIALVGKPRALLNGGIAKKARKIYELPSMRNIRGRGSVMDAFRSYASGIEYARRLQESRREIVCVAVP